MLATEAPRSTVWRHPSRLARLLLGTVFVALLLVSAVGLAGFVWPVDVVDPDAPVFVGMVDEFELGSVTALHSFSIGAYLVRLSDGSIRVYDQHEPVNGCSAPWEPARSVFRDPCHGLEYDIEGRPLDPASSASLRQFVVTTTSDDRILVDAVGGPR